MRQRAFLKTMNNIKKHIKARRSVRTYDGRTVDENTEKRLLSFAEEIKNPFEIPVEFRFLDAGKSGLSCPVVSGTELFVGGKIKNVPCVSALGYPAKKKSLRESMMRKAVKADERLPFEELFFDGSFDAPLRQEKAGKFAEPLEMVRLAPSAVNRQPWRVVITDDTAHFYLKRSKGFSHDGKSDMQMTDMGIALCHFALTAIENGLDAQFVQENPELISDSEAVYVASYTLN